MNVVALFAALDLTGETLYWVFMRGLHGPLYILAAVCAAILLLAIVVPPFVNP